MTGLIPQEKIQVGETPLPWKKSETDRMLDLYFGGAHPIRIAVLLHRSPKSVKMRLEKFTYDEESKASSYVPVKRISRSGRITENERVMIQSHQKNNVPVEVTARVLMRDVADIDPSPKKVLPVKSMKVVAPTLDLVRALRYVFHVYKKSLVTDKMYDSMVEEELEYGGGAAAIAAPVTPCPQRIKSLAAYLCEKYEDDRNGTSSST